jgi:hypothetical protein
MSIRRYVSVIIWCLVLTACGGGSGGSSPTSNRQGRIQNEILENTTALGVSTFALGVVNKFPLEDYQTPDGIGYKSVAKVVRHIATNELFTFPEIPDNSQIENTIAGFINDGHLVTHEIHVLNGPSMRKCRDQWLNNVVGKATCDQEFVRLLQTNSTMQSAVLNLFVQAIAHARKLEALGAEVLICPELEDNQTPETFQILIDLLATAGWADHSKIVRNGGRPGEFGVVRYESHGSSIASLGNLRPGDIWNNDGDTFYFNTDTTHANGAISENQIRSMIATAQQRGVITFIWSAALQGNHQVSPGNFIPYPDYTNRNYVLEKPIEQAAILLGIAPENIILK